MRICGLDLSLTSTGVATSDGGLRLVKSKVAPGIGRIVDLVDKIWPYVADADLVMVEGYSYGSNMAHARSLAELGGAIRISLYQEPVAYVDVPPSSLKKFLCDAGNANKNVMQDHARTAGYEGDPDDDLIDAWALMQMGLYAVGQAQIRVTRYRDEAIAKVPDMAAVIARITQPEGALT